MTNSKMFRYWTTLCIAIGIASCARLGEERAWNNPFDAGGTNYHPPTVMAPNDTNVAVNDSVTLVAAGNDDNGAVVTFWWSFDRGATWSLHGTPEFPARISWGPAQVGAQVVWVKAQDNDGLYSAPDSCRITVHDYRPVVRPVADTQVSQLAMVAVDLSAADSNGTIVRYLMRIGKDETWSDTLDAPRFSLSHPEGGAVTVVWGAEDDDGYLACDTFAILFNRGPVSAEMVSPGEGDTAPFVSFDFDELTGSVRLRYEARDPDGNDDTLTWSLFLGNDPSAISLLWSGRDSERTVSGLEPSATYVWKLRVHDLFGDSIESSGSFRTPHTPGGPAGMTLVRSKGKVFQMGLPGGDSGETPVHPVSFTHHFWIDTTEVTCVEFAALMGERKGNELLPVTAVSWYDAALYCNARSKRDGKDTVYRYSGIMGTPGSGAVLQDVVCDLSASGYRLPTEAEWEFAARAGSGENWFWGNSRQEIDRYVWHRDNANGAVHAVATKGANSFGLYDVYGNVWEWCNDWYGADYYAATPAQDPPGPENGAERVIRGGSWANSDDFAQSGVRSRIVPSAVNATIGFRVVLRQP